ncbi:MAG: NusG domain II-containing protein [Oscillospiraceae bacterium]|nr:NusG domain II-containing protein [Oscillospiraceae bacterium]
MDGQNRKRKFRADLLLIAALLLLAGVLYVWQITRRRAGAVAAVYVNGMRTSSYPLERETTVRLAGADGEDYNLLVIENGCARVTEASCPDKLCVHMHPIRYAGESILCLPNRVEIRVEGDTASGVDIH